MTFDITGELLFNESLGLAENRIHPWIEFMFTSVKALVYMGIVDQFLVLDWISMECIPQRLMWHAKEHLRLVEEKVERRLRSRIERVDFMPGVVNAGTGEEANLHAKTMKDLSRADVYSNVYL